MLGVGMTSWEYRVPSYECESGSFRFAQDDNSVEMMFGRRLAPLGITVFGGWAKRGFLRFAQVTIRLR
jgi:hypothetical protein